MTRIVVIFDLETTSADPRTAEPVQVSSVMFVDGQPETAVVFDELAKPSAPIQKGAFDTHGISEEMVANKPSSEQVAQSWWAVVQEFINRYEVQQDDVFFAGHNAARFDRPILSRYVQELESYRMIDTLWAARRIDPIAQNHRLSHLVGDRYVLDTELPKKAHDGLADCWMGALLLQHYLKATGRSLDSMATWLCTPQLMQTVPFGRFKGLPFSSLRPASLKWFTQPDMDPDVRFTALRYLNGQ